MVKEFPLCSKCHEAKGHIIKINEAIELTCKSCCENKDSLNSLIGVLYDLENKSRFE